MNTGLKLILGAQALSFAHALVKGRAVPALVAGASLWGLYLLCRDETKPNTILKVVP